MAGEGGGNRNDNLTHYGQSMGWLFIGLFFLLCAWYLEPIPNARVLGVELYFERAANLLFYVFTGICLFVSVMFISLAPRNDPGIGKFLKALFGGGEEGWRYSFLTTFAFGVSAFFYGGSLLIPGESGLLEWIEWILKTVALVALFFAVALAAFAIDSFFVKPILRAASSDQTTFSAFVDLVRKRATVIVPILIALVTLIVDVVLR